MTQSTTRSLPLAGSLPAFIVENTAPWEWLGVLRLLSDPREIRFVEVSGFAGNFLDASLDFTTGLISIAPLARLDAEWFKQAGQSLNLEVGLRFFMADGGIATGTSAFTVTLRDIDDTPPQSLAFVTGGSVRAGQAGATIGRLHVTDPDTTGGFTFRLLEGDAWQFEVVGDELRLRPGVKLDLADGPRRDLIIEVSDGTQAAAFSLPIEILPDPGVSPTPISYLLPGMVKAGFAWDSGVIVRGMVPEWDIASVQRAGGMITLTTKSGERVWFDRPSLTLDFGSGYLDFRRDSEAARVWLAFDTLFDRAATLNELRLIIPELWRGATDFNLVNYLLNETAEGRALGRLTNREFVRELYENITGSPPSQNVLNNQTTRLDAGLLDRIGLTMQLMNWRTRFDEFEEVVAKGIFTPRPYMLEIGAVLRVGANFPFFQEAWGWSSAFSAGTWSLRDFATGVLDHPQGQAKWAGVGHREFITRVVEEAFGTSYESFAPGATDWWVDHISRGVHTRGEFFGGVILAMTSPVAANSPFRMMPTGDFDALW